VSPYRASTSILYLEGLSDGMQDARIDFLKYGSTWVPWGSHEQNTCGHGVIVERIKPWRNGMINIEIAYFYNWKLGLVVLYIAYLSFVYTENGDYVRKNICMPIFSSGAHNL
jgi:hypothetical protein